MLLFSAFGRTIFLFREYPVRSGNMPPGMNRIGLEHGTPRCPVSQKESFQQEPIRRGASAPVVGNILISQLMPWIVLFLVIVLRSLLEGERERLRRTSTIYSPVRKLATRPNRHRC